MPSAALLMIRRGWGDDWRVIVGDRPFLQSKIAPCRQLYFP
ncbi:MAG: hypothetical protein SNJ50_00425 [Cyanobacteriota bacterium]